MHLDNGEKAAQWNAYVENKYSRFIQNTISKQRVYRVAPNIVQTSNPSCQLMLVDTVEAANHAVKLGGKVCALNFASYKNPGGGYIRGAYAQEEALCFESVLYQCLRAETGYYAYNNKNLQYGAYTNAAIYSPEMLFEHNGETFVCDVITCAAPNHYKYSPFTPEDMNTVMDERIRFMYQVVAGNAVDTLIVGAWGCGVFHQDPKFVAYALKKYAGVSGCSKVIAAVPNGNGRNAQAFQHYWGR